MDLSRLRRAMSAFLLKILVPAFAFALLTYVGLPYAHPGMPERMRIFFAAIWVAAPFFIIVVSGVLMLVEGLREVNSFRKNRR
jgi:hypothetical protein